MDNFNNLEKKIALLFSKFPGVKRKVKTAYQYLQYSLHKKPFSFSSTYPLHRYDHEKMETFFGYYDKLPTNTTRSHLLFHASSDPTHKLPRAQEPIYVVLYDLNRKLSIHRYSSLAYNWQQGTRLQWIDNERFIFNDYDEQSKKYVSRIGNLKNENLEPINFPIYDCFHDEFALSLNFQRLALLQPDYGYFSSTEKMDLSELTNDGIFHVDFKQNTHRLILSLDDIRKISPELPAGDTHHMINHIMISPDGNHFMFIHRFYKKGVRLDRLISATRDLSTIKLLADDGMVSHCAWYDNRHIFAYLRDKNSGDTFFMINIQTNTKTEVNPEIFKALGDGHPSVYSHLIAFDSYPDRSRMKSLMLFNSKAQTLEKLGSFFEPLRYRNETRCDLHPRLTPHSLFIDSVHEGKRHLYELSLKG